MLRLQAAGLLCHLRALRRPIFAGDRRSDRSPIQSVRSSVNARGLDLARYRARSNFRFRFRAASGPRRAALHAALRPADLILPA